MTPECLFAIQLLPAKRERPGREYKNCATTLFKRNYKQPPGSFPKMLLKHLENFP